jgi:hypothetical protein
MRGHLLRSSLTQQPHTLSSHTSQRSNQSLPKSVSARQEKIETPSSLVKI